MLRSFSAWSRYGYTHTGATHCLRKVGLEHFFEEIQFSPQLVFAGWFRISQSQKAQRQLAAGAQVFDLCDDRVLDDRLSGVGQCGFFCIDNGGLQ